ncbi:MAG TPA: GlsB/YeaQ/YmgE family stress response membrane protein [Actinomycetota bacterium]|nr:GlsB/YeaQ/YmgE family stress response membrane protein [Actinomycetota bacterium]
MRGDVELIRFLLVGMVSGWIAAILVRGTTRLRGCMTHVVVGMAGAVIGGFIFRAVGVSEVARVLAATAGAIVLLLVVRGLRNAWS